MKDGMIYRSIREIEDPDKLPDGIITEKNERIKRTLDLVNSMALEIASAGPEVDIYPMMADKIREITGAFAVNLSVFDDTRSEMQQRALSIESKLIKRIEDILGKGLMSLTYKVDPEIKRSMMKDVIAVSDDLHESTLGSIPKVPAKLLEKTLSLRNFIGVSFVHHKRLYGTIFIITNKDSPPIDFEILGVIKAIGSQLMHRKVVESELREYETRYSNLFMNTQDAVVLSTRDGRIVDYNPSFRDLIGLTDSEIRECRADQLYQDRTRRDEFIKEIEEKGAVKDFPIVIKRADGELRTCLFDSTLRKRNDGSIMGYQGILRDVTESSRLRRELEDEKNRAELYLDLLGHDIGNLHQGIDNALSLMSSSRDDPERSDKVLSYARDLFSKSKDLATQIKLLARMRRDKVDMEEVDLIQVLRSEVERLDSVFASRSIDSNIESVNAAHNVLADSMIGQLFFNLMHNAVKAQTETDPWIRIRVSSDGESKLTSILIEDRGSGMPEDIKDFLNSNEGGSVRKHAGLGLSIVKELIIRYGGRIQVEDVIGGDGGCRVHVWLRTG